MKLVLVMALFVVSSLALVDARYNGRVLHAKKEEISKKHDRVKSEISSLQVLLTELEDSSRIKSTAENVLNMRNISLSDTVKYYSSSKTNKPDQNE